MAMGTFSRHHVKNNKVKTIQRKFKVCGEHKHMTVNLSFFSQLVFTSASLVPILFLDSWTMNSSYSLQS